MVSHGNGRTAYQKMVFQKITGVTHLEFLHRKDKPGSPQRTQSFNISLRYFAETLRSLRLNKKNEFQLRNSLGCLYTLSTDLTHTTHALNHKALQNPYASDLIRGWSNS